MSDDQDHDPTIRPCSEAHPDSDIYCYPPWHPSPEVSAMTCHRLPDGTILELRPGQTITQEELDALAAYIPIYRRAERERRAAMTPRERADEPKAWRAAAERGVRGRG